MILTIFLLSLISSATSFSMQCIFELMFIAVLRQDFYICRPITMENFDENAVLSEVTGTHLPGMTNADVQGVFLFGDHHLRLRSFPRGLEGFFPDLSLLFMTTTSIVSFRGDEFASLPKLQYIEFVENNELERFPGNLLEFNRDVTILSLSNNNLKHIGSNFFDGLVDQLRLLDFRGNPCASGFAINRTAIANLVETIQVNCVDIHETTTTEGPSCGDLNEVVCHLQEQNQLLLQQNVEIKEKLNELSQQHSEIKQTLDEILRQVAN